MGRVAKSHRESGGGAQLCAPDSKIASSLRKTRSFFLSLVRRSKPFTGESA
jgi:hypothetical protein